MVTVDVHFQFPKCRTSFVVLQCIKLLASEVELLRHSTQLIGLQLATTEDFQGTRIKSSTTPRISNIQPRQFETLPCLTHLQPQPQATPFHPLVNRIARANIHIAGGATQRARVELMLISMTPLMSLFQDTR